MQTSKMAFSLKRGQVFFLVIVVVMTMTLFFLSYGWNASEKLYKLSSSRKSVVRTFTVGHHETINITLYKIALQETDGNNSDASRPYNDSRKNVPFLRDSLHGQDGLLPGSKVTEFKNVSQVKIDVAHVSTQSTRSDKDVTDDKFGNGVVSNHIEKAQSDNQSRTSNNTNHHIVNDHSRDNQSTSKHSLDQHQHHVNNDRHINIEDGNELQLGKGDPKDTTMKESKHLKELSVVDSTEHFVDKLTSTHTQTNQTSGVNFETTAKDDRAKYLETTPGLINDTLSDKKDNPSKSKQTKTEIKNEINDNKQTSISDKKHTDNAKVGDNTDANALTTAIKTTSINSRTSARNTGLSGKEQNNEERKIPRKVTTRFETLQLNHNVMNQFRNNLWNMGGLRKGPFKARSPNTTVRPEICNGCFRTDFKQILDAPTLCKTDTNIEVLIMISSSPTKSEARDAIRRTWGKTCYDKTSTVRCVYVFGEHHDSEVNKALGEESKRYNDIIQYAFHDSYANLTFKTMISLRWASEKCQSAKYVMKTDDDMYVNTELLPVLLRAAPDSRFLGGFCWGPSAPHRDMTSKWYVSFEQFAQSSYPTMCSGTGYVMTSDIAVDVLKISADIPFFYLEDVYMSLCLKKLGVRPTLLNGFSNQRVEFDACAYKNSVITSHEISPPELIHTWPAIQRCPKESTSPEKLYFPRYVR